MCRYYPETKVSSCRRLSTGITNLLIELAAGTDPQNEALLSQVRDIEYAIINQLSTRNYFSRNKSSVWKYWDAFWSCFLPSDALTNELVSHGELMSTCFCWIIAWKGIQADWFDVRRWWKRMIYFVMLNLMAQLTELTKKPYSTSPEETVIVTRFYWSRAKGRTTTLGRGGSDYSCFDWWSTGNVSCRYLDGCTRHLQYRSKNSARSIVSIR